MIVVFINLKDEVAKLNDFNARQSKNQMFDWAISNAGINCFTFYDRVQKKDFDSTIIVHELKHTYCMLQLKSRT